jgi:uncharacterized protein
MDVLLSAPILFFALGALIALSGARTPFPDGFAKALAAYLLVAIGLKGGVALTVVDAAAVLPLFLTAGLVSLSMPILGFAVLRKAVGLDPVNAAAIAAHYGSVSLVTFITMTKLLESQGILFGGHMVAALAIMEAPAIVTGLLLAGATGVVATVGVGAGGHGGILSLSFGHGGKEVSLRAAIREAAFNSSVLLLVGSLLIGLVIGKSGFAALNGLFVAPWDGALSLFLLEMGCLAATRLREAMTLKLGLIAFGVCMPLVGAGVGLAVASALGLGFGDAALFVTLCASASYIAVPAALSHALPTANPGLFLPLSLGITFPFNILVGIPLYIVMTRAMFT